MGATGRPDGTDGTGPTDAADATDRTDAAARRRGKPAPPAAPPAGQPPDLAMGLVAVAALSIWVGVLAVFGAGLAGAIRDPAALLPSLDMPSPMREAVMAQLAVQGAMLLTILVLGSVATLLWLGAETRRCRAILRLLVWAMIAFALVSPIVSAGPALALSGDVAAALPTLATALPFMAVQLALLLVADRALARG